MRPPRHLAGAVQRARKLRREMTEAERKLWFELRKLKLNVRRQAPIGRYIVDFVHHGSRTIIELDGGQHGHDDVADYDLARTEWLNSRGNGVVRFWNSDVLKNPYGVTETILRIIQERNTSPSTGKVGARRAPGGGG